MKKILTMLLITTLLSCGLDKGHDNNVITSKRYSDGWGTKLPPCICEFYYNTNESFQDSCNKYNLFDSLKINKK
jgi:hypothetical protein